MKFPNNLGECIDLVYAKRAERIEKQKEYEAEIEEMKAEEKRLRDHIIAKLEKSGLASGRGETCTATVTTGVIPMATDWDRIYKWVQKTGAFEIFERRISRAAFKERYEAGEGIPGVDAMEIKDLSLTKAVKK